MIRSISDPEKNLSQTSGSVSKVYANFKSQVFSSIQRTSDKRKQVKHNLTLEGKSAFRSADRSWHIVLGQSLKKLASEINNQHHNESQWAGYKYSDY